MKKAPAASFRQAVKQTPDLSDAWRAGLKALRAQDRKHIKAQCPRRLAGSVNIDAALEPKYPDDPRWDYAVGNHSAGGGEEVFWIEVHPCTPGEVQKVLDKLRWLRRWLAASAPRLQAIAPHFVWVSSGTTSFNARSPQAKRLAARGLQMAGGVFRIP